MYQRMMEAVSLTDKLNSVIYYDWFVPEEERHDSAVGRNRENLSAELKLWESYLENVAAGSYLVGAFSLADVVAFPNVAYAFRFG
ncbi:glutathione S-transferase A [Austrofundulus limnaeus]|uniref:Glutathione S-transferase A n=1 Tax=Austrofundulus limnaeus TaxID=52670 RepID=A0A2I4ALU9_AUSLI|nr:PREDICTED: glutathione S-transferase A-like [Austrofundulus limnaeus]